MQVGLQFCNKRKKNISQKGKPHVKKRFKKRRRA